MKPKKHHDRPDLIGEHRFGDIGQLLSLFIFLLVYIGDGFVFKLTTHLNDMISLYIRVPIAAIAFILSAYLVITSKRIIFDERREKPEVIRKGVYAAIRHPMYISEVLLYFALLCLNLSLISIGVWGLIIIFLYAICRYEEKILTDHFGDDYRSYMKDVPMWIPRLKQKGVRSKE